MMLTLVVVAVELAEMGRTPLHHMQPVMAASALIC